MADDKDTVIQDIRQYMSCGLEVYDREGKKAGQVDDYEPVTGYIMLRTNPFALTDLFIPFSAVTHIDARELFLAETKAELHRKYKDPPPRSVEVCERSDRDSGQDDGRTVIRVRSGYDGTPVVVGGADTGELARHIAPGYEVYTSDGEFVGRVDRYDGVDKMLLVVAAKLSKNDMAVPVALVETVDRFKGTIALAVSAADLRHFQRVPGDVLTVEGSA